MGFTSSASGREEYRLYHASLLFDISIPDGFFMGIEQSRLSSMLIQGANTYLSLSQMEHRRMAVGPLLLLK